MTSRCPILFYRPTQEPVLTTANTGKTQERLWKNAGEWIERVKISSRKKFLAVGEVCMAIF